MLSAVHTRVYVLFTLIFQFFFFYLSFASYLFFALAYILFSGQIIYLFSRVGLFVMVSGRLQLQRVTFPNFNFSLFSLHHHRQQGIRRKKLQYFAHAFLYFLFSRPRSIAGRVCGGTEMWGWQGMQGWGRMMRRLAGCKDMTPGRV